MSAVEWKPGTLLTDDDGSLFFVVDHLPVHRENPLYSMPCVVDVDGNGWRSATLDASARPLVLVDPEGREQVERLYALLWQVGVDEGAMPEPGSELYEEDVRDLQAALREFAKPTPPPIEEPTGWLARVVDAEGKKYLRLFERGAAPWRLVESSEVNGRHVENSQGPFYAWCQLDAVKVLSQGVIT